MSEKFLVYKSTPLVNLSPAKEKAFKPPFPRREGSRELGFW
jgi:hypothetical protein